MDGITLLGLIAGTLTTVAFVPQLLKTWRSKSAEDVSFGMLAVFCTGVALWFVYGLALRAWPIVVANLVTFILAVTILLLKVKYG